MPAVTAVHVWSPTSVAVRSFVSSGENAARSASVRVFRFQPPVVRSVTRPRTAERVSRSRSVASVCAPRSIGTTMIAEFAGSLRSTRL